MYKGENEKWEKTKQTENIIICDDAIIDGHVVIT